MRNLQHLWECRQNGLQALFVALVAIAILSITSPSQAGVGSGVDFNNPRGISIDNNGDFIVADFGNGNIYRVDGGTGNRVLLSDPTNAAQGPALVSPAGVVVLKDGRIFVSDTSVQAVIEVDPVTGNRSLLTQPGDLVTPFGIAAGPVKRLGSFSRLPEVLVVSDTGSNARDEIIGPVLVNPNNGNIRHISTEANRVADIQYNDPRAVAVSNKGRIYIGNFGSGSIIEVRPRTGVRRIISQNASDGDAVGTGPEFGSIIDIAVNKAGTRVFVVDLDLEAVLNVQIKSGNRTVETQTFGDPTIGAGTDLVNPAGIEIIEGGKNGSIMVTDFGLPGLVKVERTDSSRSVFSSSDIVGFGGPRDLAVLTNGNIVVADFATERVLEVNGNNGTSEVLSGSTQGSGLGFNGPVAIIELDDDTLAVSEFNQNAVFAVDRTTGNRTLISSLPEGVGAGPNISARGIALDTQDSNIIYGSSFALDAVIAVDRTTGDRTIISQSGVRGAGPALNNSLGIAVAPDGTIFLSDIGSDTVYSVDPVTGDRTIVSDAVTGVGPNLATPFGISVIDGRLVVSDAGLRAVVDVDPVTGNRTIISGQDQAVGTGVDFGNVFSTRKLNANTLVVSDFSSNAVIAVDLATGNRSIFSQ